MWFRTEKTRQIRRSRIRVDACLVRGDGDLTGLGKMWHVKHQESGAGINALDSRGRRGGSSLRRPRFLQTRGRPWTNNRTGRTARIAES